jgi:hypothetical protein
MDKAPKISTGTTLVYEKGRGGTKWPTSRFTAKVDGETLDRKDGHPRRFLTREAALKAARAEVAKATK